MDPQANLEYFMRGLTQEGKKFDGPNMIFPAPMKRMLKLSSPGVKDALYARGLIGVRLRLRSGSRTCPFESVS